MFNLFTVTPFIFLILSTFYFNRSKLKDSRQKVIITLLEAIFSYLISYLLFLEKFIPVFLVFVILFILTVASGYFLFRIQKDFYRQRYLKIETIKNNIVLFATTLLPLYVFLTIFRFLDAYKQILYSVLATIVIFFLSFFGRKIGRFIYLKVKAILNTDNSAFKYVYLILLFIFIVIAIPYMKLPTSAISKELNLLNNVRYFSYDDFPTDLKNPFQEKVIMQINYDRNIHSIIDYYYDQDYLYYYSEYQYINVFDISTGEKIYEEDIGDDYEIDKYEKKFLYYKDNLILTTEDGIFLVDPDKTTKISGLTTKTTKLFYLNNELYFLKRKTSTLFEFYRFNNNQITIVETIDLENTNFDNLIIISNHLFYKENNQYVLYDDPSIKFNIYKGLATYDEKNKIMYYTVNGDLPGYTKNNTIYQKVDINGNTSKMIVSNIHNINGILIDDYIYYTNEKSKKDRVEILKDFEIYSIFKPSVLDHKYNYSFIGRYKEKDHRLEFIQVDCYSNKYHSRNLKYGSTITIKQLVKKDIDLNLPFYTHYGIGIFIPIIICFFIPITDNRKLITLLRKKYTS